MANLEIGDLVIDALKGALEQEGECRLITSGRAQGLLPGGRLTAAKKQAQQQCLDPALGLFAVREVEEGSGKSKAKIAYVTLTRRGIDLLFESQPSAERRAILEGAANPHKEAAHEAFLRVTEEDLREIDLQRQGLDRRASDLRQVVKQFVEEQLAAIKRARTELEQQYREMEEILTIVAEPDPKIGRTEERRITPLQPTTDGDIDFQQHLCRQLVSTWRYTKEPEAREALEEAMMNSGLEPVGEIGEIVSFDNRDHHTESNLMPGQPAVVIEPGWQLISPRGTLLIARTHVKAADKPESVVHAPHVEH